MGKKITDQELEEIQQSIKIGVCNVCKGTGQVYVIIERTFWGKKEIPTTIAQPCYKCSKQ